MTYTILIYETPAELGARTDGTRKDAYWGAYRLSRGLDRRRRGQAQSGDVSGPTGRSERIC